MRCELCFKIGTEKHHITYFPKHTFNVHSFPMDNIDLQPFKYSFLVKYRRNDSVFETYFKKKQKVCNLISMTKTCVQFVIHNVS